MKKYKEIVLEHDGYYEKLLKAQNKLPKIPNWEVNLLAKLLSRRLVVNYIWKKYKEI